MTRWINNWLRAHLIGHNEILSKWEYAWGGGGGGGGFIGKDPKFDAREYWAT